MVSDIISMMCSDIVSIYDTHVKFNRGRHLRRVKVHKVGKIISKCVYKYVRDILQLDEVSGK